MKVTLSDLHRLLRVMARNLLKGSLNQGGVYYTMEEYGSLVSQAQVRSVELQRLTQARAADTWTDGNGPVLWWMLPVSEAPYVGTPSDQNWPGTHTHWTPLPAPTLESVAITQTIQ